MSRLKTASIYRLCSPHGGDRDVCLETAHDCRWDIQRRTFVWACRNCGKLALDRRGQVREYRPEYMGPKPINLHTDAEPSES